MDGRQRPPLRGPGIIWDKPLKVLEFVDMWLLLLRTLPPQEGDEEISDRNVCKYT